MPASRLEVLEQLAVERVGHRHHQPPAGVRSSGSSTCFCAKGLETVRVASAMSSLSGSIFR